jgi:tetratricopeptide (TPR) repeat protein
VALLLLDWWPLGRIGRSGGRALIAAVREKLPLAALAAAVTVLTVSAQSRGGAVATLATLPVADRLASAAASPWFLLGKTLWPSGLAPVYPHDIPSAGFAAAGALGTAGLAMVAARLRDSHPYLAFGWFGWLILLAPVSNLFQVGAEYTADRYTWLPHVPLLLAGATAVTRFLPARSAWRRAALAGALCGALALALAAGRQTALWGDELALFSHAAAVTPGNWKMHYALGRSLSRRGRDEEAIRQYELALEARPRYPEALNNLGRLYGARGNVATARELFTRAVIADPNHATSWYNLGYLRESAGDLQGALPCYEKAVALDPGSPEGWGRRGIVLQQLGRTGEAVASCEEALRRDAASPAARACSASVGRHGGTPRAPQPPPGGPAAP